jgi:hypothetical protein
MPCRHRSSPLRTCGSSPLLAMQPNRFARMADSGPTAKNARKSVQMEKSMCRSLRQDNPLSVEANVEISPAQAVKGAH